MADPDTASQPAAYASVQSWIDALERAEKDKKRAKWEKRCKTISKKYADEEEIETESNRKYAMLWSNQQTLQPVVYARCPRPEVNRRFKDEDPVGRVSSEVLERALTYQLDAYDFDGVLRLCVADYLLYARGQAWVRYVPHMKSVKTPVTPVTAEAAPAAEVAGAAGTDTDDKGPEVSEDADAYQDATGKTYGADEVKHDPQIGPHIVEDVLDYEEVICDHVHYDDFIHPSVRTWPELPWLARRAFMTRDELIDRFGEKIGRAVPLDWKPEGDRGDNSTANATDDPDAKAAIYEVWDKRAKKVCWISKGYPSDYLDERDDPLNLPDFWPCPRPMQGTTTTSSLVPIPDYVFYQDQAEEIDQLTAKIGRLEKGLRLVGFYAGSKADALSNLFSREDNELVPIEDWASLTGQGGVKGLMDWVPLDMVVQALEAMVKLRAQLIEDVYQITGIADILRGASDPNETAAAQSIKANWGAVRVRDKQKEVARFARDLIRIMGQIISGRFKPQTLKVMTGVQLMDTVAQKQQAQQQIAMQQQAAAQAAQAQQMQAGPTTPAGAPGSPAGPSGPGAPPPPAAPQPQPPPAPPPVPFALQRQLANPTWEEVAQLLQDEASRQFRIDVETDSTIEPDEQADKASAVEFVTTISEFVQRASTAPPQAAPLLGETLKYLTRRFRAGRELEDIIDKVADSISNAPPPAPQQDGKGADPAAMVAAQARMKLADIAGAKEQREQFDSQAHLALDARKLALDEYEAQHAARTQFVDIGGRP